MLSSAVKASEGKDAEVAAATIQKGTETKPKKDDDDSEGGGISDVEYFDTSEAPSDAEDMVETTKKAKSNQTTEASTEVAVEATENLNPPCDGAESAEAVPAAASETT